MKLLLKKIQIKIISEFPCNVCEYLVRILMLLLHETILIKIHLLGDGGQVYHGVNNPMDGVGWA